MAGLFAFGILLGLSYIIARFIESIFSLFNIPALRISSPWFLIVVIIIFIVFALIPAERKKRG